MNKYEKAITIMNERFGKDNLITLVTMDGSRASARIVNSYYEDGAIYVVTYSLSNKMKQIGVNSEVAVCSIDWFSGHGVGENLGWVLDEKNAEMMTKLRSVFDEWYTNGHVDEEDPNTCLLRINLTDGVIIDHDKQYGEWRYEVNFTKKNVQMLNGCGSCEIVDFPEESRTGIMKITNAEWSVVYCDLSAFKGKNVTIRYSVDVKRIGASGNLMWQVNNPDYPAVGLPIDDAAENIWHLMKGEWTGVLTVDDPNFSLSTWENNSDVTAYYIDNFNIEITEVD